MKNLLKFYKSQASAQEAADKFKSDGKGLFSPIKHGNTNKWILKQIATPEVMEQAFDEATKPTEQVIEKIETPKVEAKAAAPKKAKTLKSTIVKADRKFVVRVTKVGPGRGHYLMTDGGLTPWKFQAMHFDTGADAQSKANDRGSGPGETVDVVPFDNAWFEAVVDGKMTKFKSYKDAIATAA